MWEVSLIQEIFQFKWLSLIQINDCLTHFINIIYKIESKQTYIIEKNLETSTIWKKDLEYTLLNLKGTDQYDKRITR